MAAHDVGTIAREAARRFGDRPLVVGPGGPQLTFAELDARAERLARGLHRHGVGRGDVVALRLPSGGDFLVAYVAAARLGAVTTAISPTLSDREVASIVDVTTPAIVLSTRDELESISRDGPDLPDLPADPSRPVAIVLTSGTTGRPKGALFTNRELEAIRRVDIGDSWADPSSEAVPILSTTQFAHIGMMTKLTCYLKLGTIVHVLDRWDPQAALARIAEQRIPGIGGVAPMIAMMLAVDDFDSYDLDCVQTMIVGGAPSPPELIREARERFGAAYSNRYSSTESGGCGTAVPFDSTDEVEILYTAGRPRGPVQITVRDDEGQELPAGEVGEIWLRSPTQFVGYWNNPEATAAALVDGWVRTGDLGSIDEAGRLRPAGRCKEAYIRGGYNVLPAEVEAQLREHPAIADAAVVPRPHAWLGQVGVAVVVPRPGAAAPTLEEVRDFLRDRLARYKQPEAVHVVDELPMTSMNKLDRARLEEMVGGTPA